MSNHSFDIFRKLSLLISKGIHLSDVLNFMGIDRVYIYGIGEMGKIVLSDLSGRFSVPMIFDQNADEQKHITFQTKINEQNEAVEYSFEIFSPSNIPDNSVPILITPATCYYEILTELREKGIKKQRLLSLNLLLYYGIYFQKELLSKISVQKFPLREYLIVGGQFSNKGSQFMIFTAVNEIKNRYQDALVWFCPNFWDDEYQQENKYKILILPDGADVHSTLYELLPRLDGIIDVSGYALASHGRINETKRYMNYLQLAKSFQISYYIMPQSFGPFDYDEKTKEELISLLSFAKVIYAREREGYRLLVDHFHLTNVKYSKDLVLQNKNISLKNIYRNLDDDLKIYQKYNIFTENNVAVIPNIQNYRYGNQEKVLQMYIDIVQKLMSLGREVYIISYSEDWDVCKDIFEAVKKNKKAHLYNEEFDCIEFGELIRNFHYVIASRFHAVVHAYKEYKPCVVIGWAEKYKELLKSFHQEKFVFNVQEFLDKENILQAVEYLDQEYEKESRVIASIMPSMQKENCFDVI